MWFPKIPQYTTLFTVYGRNVNKISGQNGLLSGIVLTDLSKAFDSIARDLLIAKLNAYSQINREILLLAISVTENSVPK